MVDSPECLVHFTVSPVLIEKTLKKVYSKKVITLVTLYKVGNNDLYRVKTQGGKQYIFKLFAAMENLKQIESIASFLEVLRAKGLSIAGVVQNDSGALFTKIEMPSRTQFGILIPFLDSNSKSFNLSKDAKAYGEILGTFHAATYSTSVGLNFEFSPIQEVETTYLDLIDEIFYENLMDNAFLKALLADVFSHIGEYKGQLKSEGIVHGDLHLGNFISTLCRSNRLTLIDFEHSFYGPLVYDLATLKHCLWLNGKNTMLQAWPAIIQGYLTTSKFRGCDPLLIDFFVVIRHLWRILHNLKIAYYRGDHWRDKHFLDEQVSFLKEVASHIKEVQPHSLRTVNL